MICKLLLCFLYSNLLKIPPIVVLSFYAKVFRQKNRRSISTYEYLLFF
nr:hypothetical protein [Scenedesmaceae sp. YH-2023b]